MRVHRIVRPAALSMLLALAAVLALAGCSKEEEEARAPAEMPQEPTMKGEATTADQSAAGTQEGGKSATAQSAAGEEQSGAGKAMEQMKETAQSAAEDVQAAAESAADKAQAAAESAAEEMQAAAGRDPEKIYQTYCQACHKVGVAGAPKLGDTAAWAPRIDKGMDTLMDHAVNGLNAMPPKGTCSDCSRAELKATVEYMVSESQ